MITHHYKNIEAEKVGDDWSKGAITIRWLVNRDMGANHFAMRYFEMAPGARVAPHSHEGEHEVFILEGKGVMKGGDDERVIGPGSVVFVPSNELHGLRNDGEETLRYLCCLSFAEESQKRD